MLMDCSDSDSDSDSNVERRESFLSHTTYEPDAPVSSPALKSLSDNAKSTISALEITKALTENSNNDTTRFHVEKPTTVSSDLESLFSVKKQNNTIPADKVSDNFRGVPFEKKDTPEFIWVKQYTKVYDVNDPSKTFPIFSHYKNTSANKKNSPKITSIPLVAPSEIKALDLSASTQHSST
jgi:hypothetical protein